MLLYVALGSKHEVKESTKHHDCLFHEEQEAPWSPNPLYLGEDSFEGASDALSLGILGIH
jgi:hypothetical protein